MFVVASTLASDNRVIADFVLQADQEIRPLTMMSAAGLGRRPGDPDAVGDRIPERADLSEPAMFDWLADAMPNDCRLIGSLNREVEFPHEDVVGNLEHQIGCATRLER